MEPKHDSVKVLANSVNSVKVLANSVNSVGPNKNSVEPKNNTVERELEHQSCISLRRVLNIDT